MFSRVIGEYGRIARDTLALWLAGYRVHPNLLTIIGLVVTIYAALLFATGRFLAAGVVLIVAGACDILDGTLARLTRQVTRFGAFLDSVLDRYSDVIVFLGLMVYFARPTSEQSLFYVVLTGIAMVGSFMTSYTRARAECLIPQCRVGFLERPERLGLLIIGALTEVPGAEGSYFLHKMPAVLWLIAILSHWTVAQRVYYTWKMTQAVDVEASPSAPVSPPVRALSSAHSVAAAETRVEREATS
jgi:CDP-diacylglycerol--glycerol-3-phosphate 3-phosphatidyltransferase